MSNVTDKLVANIKEHFGDSVTVSVAYDEVTMIVDSENIVQVCADLRDKPNLAFEELIDVCGVDYLTFGQVEWETIGHDYNVYFPDRMRNLDNLRRQFNKQVKKKAPTGDPNIPEYVLAAKRIQLAIVQKADSVKLGEGDDTDDDPVTKAVGKAKKVSSAGKAVLTTS